MADRRDPFRTFNFRLEIDNVPIAAFSEVCMSRGSWAVCDSR